MESVVHAGSGWEHTKLFRDKYPPVTLGLGRRERPEKAALWIIASLSFPRPTVECSAWLHASGQLLTTQADRRHSTAGSWIQRPTAAETAVRALGNHVTSRLVCSGYTYNQCIFIHY